MGAGGAYLALEQPWAGGEQVAAVDVATDAGAGEPASGKRSKRKRRKSKTAGGGDSDFGEPIPELSAADRQLIWRGDRVALPARDLDFAAGDSGRALEPGEIDAGIRSNSDEVVACIEEARGAAPLTATIEAELLVDGGRATSIRLRAPRYLFDRGFSACARRAIKGMRFANTGAPTVVSVPFELR